MPIPLPSASFCPTPLGTAHSSTEPLSTLLSQCIQCGMCLSACPTYITTAQEAESPRGRLYLLQQWLAGQHHTVAESTPAENDPPLSLAEIQPYLNHCLGCRACETACPSQVRYGAVLDIARQTSLAQAPWFQKLGAGVKKGLTQTVFSTPWALEGMKWGATLYQGLGLSALWRACPWLQRMVPSLWAMEALLPPQVAELWPSVPSGLHYPPNNPEKPTVALHLGCVMNPFMARSHWATLALLRLAGFGVRTLALPCCGALSAHAGDHATATHQVAQTQALCQEAGVAHLVLNSAGCGAHLKETMPEASVAIEEVHTLLLAAFEAQPALVTALQAQAAEQPSLRVVHQPACHLYHAQGVKEAPLALLALLCPHVAVVPLAQASTCCGSAGVYNVEQPTHSNAVLAEKMSHLQAAVAAGAERVIAGNPGCLLQLQKGLRQQGLALATQHPLEVVAEALCPDWPAVAKPSVAALLAWLEAV